MGSFIVYSLAFTLKIVTSFLDIGSNATNKAPKDKSLLAITDIPKHKSPANGSRDL